METYHTGSGGRHNGRFRLLLPMLILVASYCPPVFAQNEIVKKDRVLSLVGSWRFLLPVSEFVSSQETLPTLPFNDTIELPGTTDTRRRGPLNKSSGSAMLTRVFSFEGPAWYEREFVVPAVWRGRQITLFLERTKYTQVWLDGRRLGENPIICSPQEYSLGVLAPGKHRLTIQVDNSKRPVPGEMHQMSDNTQGNWNGIIGRIELSAADAVRIEDVQIYPDAARRTARVLIKIGNTTKKRIAGVFQYSLKGRGVKAGVRRQKTTIGEDGGFIEYALDLGERAALWDEFQPNLHELTIVLRGEGFEDQRKITFGLRDFTSAEDGFRINNRVTFLRGKHDACVFPLTGHPPMQVEGWRRYFRILQDYGLNHVRFHSWTPPEAAFVAADELGFYLQPELPFWGDFTEEIKARLKPEAERLLRAFGNHPSFVMFALGNENRHSREVMGSLVGELRALDDRRLYAQGSNNFLWDPMLSPGDDYLTTARVRNPAQGALQNVRGSYATVDGSNGFLQTGPANTQSDYSRAVAGFPRPVISHEIGQYTVFPNFREIPKYTGVMRPDNLEYFRQKLAEAGLAGEAEAFFRASGKLAALGYREEIELALRTPRFGGFQLLDLQDFPGQGTALVGLLDAFMDSKGLITPAEWRQFCGPIVLLARFDKYVWNADEAFTARLQLAHYGEKDLPAAELIWTLRDEKDQVLQTGRLPAARMTQGGVRDLGTIKISFLQIRAPSRLNLEIELAGTKIKNRYPLWIYPSLPMTENPKDVHVRQSFDDEVRRVLTDGGRLVLMPDGRKPLLHSVGGGFTTDFWNFPMFHNKPGTMGLLVDPAHPALSLFPTEFHSNWQWFEIVSRAQPLVLDSLPRDYKPIIRVIDNMERNHQLGIVFEFKVGKGKLLVCASDLSALSAVDPAARQLRRSLFEYAASEKFSPQAEISFDALKEMFQTVIPIKGKASASSRAAGWPVRGPEQVIDGNYYTNWQAADASQGQWWQIGFEKPVTFRAIEILWETAGVRYRIETSQNGGATWQILSDQTQNAFTDARHRIELNAKNVSVLRLSITGQPENSPAIVREVQLLDD